MTASQYKTALAAAMESHDQQCFRDLTEAMMQEMSNDFPAVTQKWGPDFHGYLLTVADAFAASLRLIADENDISINRILARRLETCVIAPKRGGGENE